MNELWNAKAVEISQAPNMHRTTGSNLGNGLLHCLNDGGKQIALAALNGGSVCISASTNLASQLYTHLF